MFFLASEFITLSVRLLNKKSRYKELRMSNLEVVLSKTNIPKLDNTHYASWSSCMRAYLRSKDLYKVVTGEVTPANKKSHEKANDLISHLGNTAFDLVITAKNKKKPVDIWNAIVKQYAPSSVNHEAWFWLKFMKYEENSKTTLTLVARWWTNSLLFS